MLPLNSSHNHFPQAVFVCPFIVNIFDWYLFLWEERRAEYRIWKGKGEVSTGYKRKEDRRQIRVRENKDLFYYKSKHSNPQHTLGKILCASSTNYQFPFFHFSWSFENVCLNQELYKNLVQHTLQGCSYGVTFLNLVHWKLQFFGGLVWENSGSHSYKSHP